MFKLHGYMCLGLWERLRIFNISISFNLFLPSPSYSPAPSQLVSSELRYLISDSYRQHFLSAFGAFPLSVSLRQPIRFHLSGQADMIQVVFLLPYVLREASQQLGFKSRRFPTFDEHMSSISKPSMKANTFFLNFSVSQMPLSPHKTVE